jgi:hypothetical protein
MNFCTYFDSNYLLKFLCLYDSIKKFNFEFKFYVLALDDRVVNFFNDNSFENVVLIKLDSLEKEFPDLLKAKNNRSLIEYYFTLSPFLPLYIRKKFSITILSYFDSDFYFFKDPTKSILKNTFESSVVLIKQNSNPKYGYYNMGWIDYNFSYNETEEILNVWSKQCLEWCKDIAVDNKYADQKYLDSWVLNLKYIKILSPNYSCLSPWDNNIVIENNLNSMIAYHFHGFEIYRKIFTTGFHRYNKNVSRIIIEKVYLPYIENVENFSTKYHVITGNIRNKTNYKQLFFFIRKIYSSFKKIFFRDYQKYK